MSFDSDRFIIEIQNRPALWDTRCNEYSNKVFRGRAWEEICEIFVSSFKEMNSVEKNKAGVEMQRKWKSFRDSFRRELSKIKKTKSGSAAETGRKEYVYFKQLIFLMPICETKPQDAEDGEGSSQTVTLEDESSTPTTSHNRPTTSRKRKGSSTASEEQLLLKTLAKNIETRTSAKELDDPDRHFLLSLLPHFKSVPDHLKLEVQMEFMSTLKRYKEHQPATLLSYISPAPNPSLISYRQTFPVSAGTSYIPTHQARSTSTVHDTYLQQPSTDSTHDQRILTELQPMDSSELEASQSGPSSNVSSICDDYF